jgi:regulator of sigma E protease
MEKLSKYSWVLLVAIVVALLLAKWTLLVAILGLALLITVHELGHFVFAKAFGMRVEKFYVGFPPAAWKRQRGETEYGIGVIPLGGFCKISGMTEDELKELTKDVRHRRDTKKISADEAEREIAAIEGRTYYTQKVWKRNLTIFAGPLFNFVGAAVILLVYLLAVGQAKPTLTVDTVMATAKIGATQQQTPAAVIGLRPGDTLLGANGRRWTQWTQATAFFQANPHKTIELTYRTRAGVVKTAQVTLTENPDNSHQGFLGVVAKLRTDRPTPWVAVGRAAKQTVLIVGETFKGFWWLITGKVHFGGNNGAVGPVGIVDLSQRAERQSWYPVLLAFLSVNLGIVNLLPILPFDGGHIFFNSVESARRGRRVKRRTLERVIAVGTTLLVALFIYLTINDIRRILKHVFAVVAPHLLR